MSDDRDDCREVARAAFLEGYAFGKGVEELKPISERTAQTRFERWWELNRPTDD